MADAFRHQLTDRSPAPGGLDLQAAVERGFKIDGGFHGTKLPSFMAIDKDGPGPVDSFRR